MGSWPRGNNGQGDYVATVCAVLTSASPVTESITRGRTPGSTADRSVDIEIQLVLQSVDLLIFAEHRFSKLRRSGEVLGDEYALLHSDCRLLAGASCLRHGFPQAFVASRFAIMQVRVSQSRKFRTIDGETGS